MFLFEPAGESGWGYDFDFHWNSETPHGSEAMIVCRAEEKSRGCSINQDGYNSVVKAGKHVLELLFDGRLRLVLVKPQSEQSERLSC